MSFQLSKKEIVKEILRCGKDSSYFVNNYCRISHPLKGLVPFKTYPYQNDLLDDFNDYRILYDGGLDFNVNKSFAFTTELNYRYDNDPQGNLGSSYIQVSNGISFNF